MTTITPPLGKGAVMNQATSYDAIDVRRATAPGLQEGVLSAGSYEVVQRAAGGAAMFVDIAASTGDGALVQGDAVTGQSLYRIAPHSALITETITAAHATLPRVDQVVLEILDHAHDASGSSLARTRIVDGTATAGATLDNRTGVAALPASSLLLADVHVPAADTTISNSQIRDRRKWALGAFSRNVSSGATYTTGSGSMVEIDTTLLKPRIECSGVPLRAVLTGSLTHSVAGSTVSFEIWIDGALVEANRTTRAVASGGAGGVLAEWVFVPTAGSHRFSPVWLTSAATASLSAASPPAAFTVEEIVRQNMPNNGTTTG